jgi:photosystem II stability/assembly factor-like uncharacterized protein
MSAIHRRRFSAFAAFLFVLASPLQGQSVWQRQSPLPYPPGEFEGVHMTSPDHIFAVSDGLGGFEDALHESFDGGETWVRRELGLGPDPSYREVWFWDTNLGFILGNGSASNLRTTNGGVTWQVMDPANFAPFTWYGIKLLDGQFGYAHGNGMPAFTQNAGLTWTHPELEGNPPEPYFAFQRVGGFTSDLGVGLGAGEMGIWRTTNRGLFWELVYSDPEVGGIIMLNDQVTLAFRPNSVLRTTNQGDTWTSVPLPASGSWQPLKFSQNVVVALHWDGTAIRTTNGGLSWQMIPPLESMALDFDLIDASTAVIAQFPVDNEDPALYRTQDGGATWTGVGPAPTLNIWGVDFFDHQSGFAAGFDNARYLTRDGGVTWTRLNSGAVTYLDDVLMFDTQNGLVVGERWILRTFDGGQYWRYEERIDELFDIDKLPSGRLLAVGVQGHFRTSDDQGESWQESRPLWTDFVRAKFIDDQEGWVTTGFGDYGNIYHTTNGGATWEHQFGPTLSTYWGLGMGSSEVGLVGGTFEGILRTLNGGEDWIYINTVNSHEIYAIEFIDENSVFVGGSFGYIARSDDAGINWDVFDTGIQNAITAIDVIDENTIYAVATNGITLHTTDGGQTWIVEDVENTTPFFNSFLGVDALPGGKVWAVGEFGAIYLRDDATQLVEASLVRFSVPFGTRLSGNLNSLRDRDGNVMRIQSVRRSNGQEWAEIQVRAQSPTVTPSRLDVTTATSSNIPGATGRIWIRNFQTSRWVLLETFAQGTTELVRVLGNLPNPAAFVNPANGQVYIRIRLSKLADPFTMGANHVRVDVAD